MSKLEQIIALENEVENNISNAKEAKEALLAKARLEANKVIEELKKDSQNKVLKLQKEASSQVLEISKENEVAKAKLHKKIQTDYKDVTSKYLDILKNEVTSK